MDPFSSSCRLIYAKYKLGLFFVDILEQALFLGFHASRFGVTVWKDKKSCLVLGFYAII
jgi:hypothetical protein